MSSSTLNQKLLSFAGAGVLLCSPLLATFPAFGADENLDQWLQDSGSQQKKIKHSSDSAHLLQAAGLLPGKAAQRSPKPAQNAGSQALPAGGVLKAQEPLYAPQAADGNSSQSPVDNATGSSPSSKQVASAINAASPGHAAPPVLLKGQVTFCIPRGTPLKLKLASVPMPEMKMEMRDEEGNLRPAQVGEIITAKITEDIYVDDNKVIPEGTIFYGRVSKIYPPRHVGRPGHLELSFDKLKTPDGRKFAFKAEANNFRESTPKSKMKGAGRLAAHAAGGAALGALVAYKIFGPEQTVAMHGYNIAGGAAIGAAGGLAYALWKRGPHAVLEPGDEFAMSIDTDLLIPAATSPTAKAPPANMPGLEMDVLKKKIVKDGLGGHLMRLETSICNRSHKKLSSIDLFLEDDLGNRCPLTPDIDEDAQEVFYVQPLSMNRIVCTFQVQYPKLKHKLIWLDHVDHSVIFEQKI